MGLTHAQFKDLLSLVCGWETSSDPERWTPKNPLWGHCAVASLLAQDFFGGEVLRASLAKYPEFMHMRSHYWNRLPDGQEIDFTKSQFQGAYPADLVSEVRQREYVLSFPETAQRYELLKRYLHRIIPSNAK